MASALARPFQVVGQGDLAIHRVSLDHNDATTRSFDERGIVSRIGAVSMRSAQFLGPKCLRRLHGDERSPVGSVDDSSYAVDVVHHLDRVGHRNTGDRGIRAVSDRIDHPLVNVDSGKWTGSIVHTDDRCLGRNRSESRTHRGRPAVTTGNSTLAFSVSRGHHDDHAIARLLRDHTRPIDDTPVTEVLILLESAETSAASTTDHDGPDDLVRRHRPGG